MASPDGMWLRPPPCPDAPHTLAPDGFIGINSLAQAVLTGLSRPQQNQPAGLCELLSVPTQLPTPECVRAGREDLVCGPRPLSCTQSQKGRAGQMLGPF